jgi:hypothetical protein
VRKNLNVRQYEVLFPGNSLISVFTEITGIVDMGQDVKKYMLFLFNVASGVSF